jgi:ABC-2 type transport system ATP-binding protein
MSAWAVLSLRNVTLRYGGFVAVDGLSLEVQSGEVFGLLGPNGSGKSTTLSAVAGALPAATGEIRVAGLRSGDDPLGYRRQIGLVPQELALFEELTAEQNLLFFGRLYGLTGLSLRRRTQEVLDFVRLREHGRRRVRLLSGGMQRRLNLACALLHEPALLLLDEPTVGLDIQSRDAIFASLRDLRDRGRALVFTTHHLEEAELLCDRIGIMDHGRLIAQGTLRQLSADLPDDAPLPATCWSANGTEQWSPSETVTARGASLERVFLGLTGRSLRDS